MGAWNELDTEITVDVDTSDLEKILTLDDIFEPVKETAENLIKGLQDGGKEAVKDIARRNKSFQEQIIAEKCKNPSGMLQSSIHASKQNDYSYLVGTVIKHIYPMALEFGRKPLVPIRAKALAFYADSGELIFRKRVGEAKPRPFVAPAYERTERIAEEIVLRKVEIAKRRI